MKKIILVVFSISIFAVSCKKDRVCECTSIDSSGGGTSTYKVTYYSAKKKDARLLCAAEATQYDIVTPVAVAGDKTTCELK